MFGKSCSSMFPTCTNIFRKVKFLMTNFFFSSMSIIFEKASILECTYQKYIKMRDNQFLIETSCGEKIGCEVENTFQKVHYK